MRNEDRERLDYQRSRAAKYFVEKYSREERYLQIFARDFAAFLNSANYLMEKDLDHQFYFDFLCSFDSLKEKMKEFRWSKEFLSSRGINFQEIKKLYFAVC